MYKIELNNSLFDYLIKILDDEKLKNKILENKYKQHSITYFDLDVDTKLDLMEYVEDKQVEIGFVNEDYLNEDGRNLQAIYDEIYRQTN
ncbi:hypothetical protein EXN65_19705 [Clostridium botulinum]|uniref:hypothetical protein n=1 Tax=Clostridium botulinum TaxID=1491 RepID=UPI000EC6C952|nr:hypothetical protein [Clostridium botulinum]MBY6879669.1 hypothetical protein [Clostridium botulinum]NEZ85991.1 hypothetical protein [Clostridium botulinum]NFB02647.1 hypothetical protein [Clostridium botulinum]NFE32639.1 hypothetical protein [Clostridium botulinum]RFM19397.1 hypothetical protein C1147_11070 [Clostridium botulinum]